MGNWFGGESKDLTETKVADSTGTLNNTIIFRSPVQIQGNVIVILLSIICAIKILEIALFAFREHRKALKKRYENNPR